jgi:hypothetical protein
MKDYWTHLETLRKQAAEAALISALATGPQKCELLAKHAAHLDTLAPEVERATAASNEPEYRRHGPPGLHRTYLAETRTIANSLSVLVRN